MLAQVVRLLGILFSSFCSICPLKKNCPISINSILLRTIEFTSVFVQLQLDKLRHSNTLFQAEGGSLSPCVGVLEKETCQCFGIALVAIITHWFGWIY